MEQFGKYSVQNRATGEIFENPSCIHDDCGNIVCKISDKRMKYIKDYYDAIVF